MIIRAYKETDVEAVADLFTASIHTLAVSAYSAEQRAAWAPEPPDIAEWRSRLAGLETFVDEEDGALRGFISFESNGHIDLLYTSPVATRRGVASGLYGFVEGKLIRAEVAMLHTEASLVAAPFFARYGFTVVEEQRVMRRGVEFSRFAMTKVLGAGR